MTDQIPSRIYAHGAVSYQVDNQMVVERESTKVTYVLDQVTERGATFRVSVQFGTRKPEVYWLAVFPHNKLAYGDYPTRIAARQAIGF